MLLNIFVLALGVVLLWQQPQATVFHGTTDVVLVDVQVVTRDGVPVGDLSPADFSLRVDGKPRAMTRVLFQKVNEWAGSAAAEPATWLPSLSPPPPAASYIMFVVDPASMRPEASRILFDQAAAFMASLPADHVVGLTVAPSRSVQHPFSRLRQSVAAEFRRQLGSYSGRAYGGDQLLGSLAALEAGIDALRAVDGRRTLVFFSDLFPAPAEENLRDVAWHANAADVAIYVVSSDAMSMASVSNRNAPPEPRGSDVGPLPMLADLTGGAFYRRGVSGAMVFDRFERTLSAQYVVAFDVEASDRNGKRHTIDVKVNRKNVDVRFRQEFIR